jgi:hypothetical protein
MCGPLVEGAFSADALLLPVILVVVSSIFVCTALGESIMLFLVTLAPYGVDVITSRNSGSDIQQQPNACISSPGKLPATFFGTVLNYI